MVMVLMTVKFIKTPIASSDDIDAMASQQYKLSMFKGECCSSFNVISLIF